jgi:hypothetical protein
MELPRRIRSEPRDRDRGPHAELIGLRFRDPDEQELMVVLTTEREVRKAGMMMPTASMSSSTSRR